MERTVDVRDLRFVYPRGGRPAVDGMTFAIDSGEIFGFLGPSGAGKSTTQRILTGLLRGWTGTVEVLGHDLASWGTGYYERIGVSFELPNHYAKLTARENLRFFASLYDHATEDPDALLAVVELADVADQRVGEFSKGMAMRLGLARALLPRPQLLFCDEPTSGLDPVRARTVKGLLRGQAEAGRTVFLTTHDMGVADDLCDRVAFVVDGRIAAIDAPRQLRLLRGDRQVRVEYRDGDGLAVAEFPLDGLAEHDGFRALLRTGVVETIHTSEATLDDVFVEVTGRRLT